MTNIFQTMIDATAKIGDPANRRSARTRLHTTIAEFQRSAYDAFLLDSSEDPERGKALELFKKETQDALKAIDKLQGWE